MSDELERRSCAECRIEASDDGKRIRGTAIVFNAPSVNLGGFREIIAPEAVDRTLRDALDVHAYFDHDSGKVLGRTRAGTLSLRKSNKGLEINIDPDTEISYVRDLMRSIARGDITGMSFGFRALDDDWDMNDEMPVRTVTDMIVSEVSVVSKPAYPQTSVAVRSLERALAAKGNRIDWLRKWHRTQLAR